MGDAVIKLMVTIVDRGRSSKAVDLFKAAGLPFHYACLGHGTANSDILDYLGLGETQKDVLLTGPSQSLRPTACWSGRRKSSSCQALERGSSLLCRCPALVAWCLKFSIARRPGRTGAGNRRERLWQKRGKMTWWWWW